MTNPLNTFFDSLAQKNFCDVVFVFPKEDNKKITANKNVLVSACDEFKNMFLKDGKVVEWSEKDNGMDVVPVSDILYKCFEILINNIYNIEMFNEKLDSSKFPEITWSDGQMMIDELTSFQVMATKFKLSWLTQWSQYLTTAQFPKSITTDNCLSRLARSLELKFEDSNCELTNFILKNQKSVLLTRKFAGVTSNSLKYVLRNCYAFSKHKELPVDALLMVNFVIAWAFYQCKLNSLPDSTANLKSFLEPLLYLMPLKFVPKDTFELNPLLENLFNEEDKISYNVTKAVDIPASQYNFVRIKFNKNVRLLSTSNVIQSVCIYDSLDNRNIPILQNYDSSNYLEIFVPFVVLKANHEYFVNTRSNYASYSNLVCSTCNNTIGANYCNSCKTKAANDKCPCHEKIALHEIDVHDPAKSVISNTSKNSSNITHQIEFVLV